jgi:pilus assembly protein CpaE
VSARRRLAGEDGQAQVELVAVVPIAVVLAVVILQLLAVGYSQSLADGAAEAGAYAVAAGQPPEAAALAALPGWAAERAEVESDGGRIVVSLRAPTLFEVAGKRVEVDSSAWARPAAG